MSFKLLSTNGIAHKYFDLGLALILGVVFGISLLITSFSPGIDHMGHLGGMIGGIVLCLFIRPPLKKNKYE